MRELLPGLFHWTTFHEPIGADVSSYYVQPAGIVIDPKVPVEGFEALPGEPQQVVLTSGHHHRDAAQFAERYGIPITASRPATERMAEFLSVDTYTEVDEVAPAVTGIHIVKLHADWG